MTQGKNADAIVAEADTGARNPEGVQGCVILVICLAWSVFQLYIASSLPGNLAQWTGVSFFSTVVTQARLIHLAFALVLATMAFPLGRMAPRDCIPFYDWGLMVLGVGTCFYLIIFREQIANRPGLWTTADVVVSAMGIIVLLISVYRSLGLPLVVIASGFILFAFFGGQSEWVRDITNYGGGLSVEGTGALLDADRRRFRGCARGLDHHDFPLCSFWSLARSCGGGGTGLSRSLLRCWGLCAVDPPRRLFCHQ